MSSLTTFPAARVPSDAEVRARTNVLVQLWRFAILNVKMIVMVSKGHH